MNKNFKERFRKLYFKFGFMAGAFLTFFLITGWYFGKELAIESNQNGLNENTEVVESK